jgi:hypothetical protein
MPRGQGEPIEWRGWKARGWRRLEEALGLLGWDGKEDCFRMDVTASTTS